MAPETTLYENRPGGTIVHFEGGGGEHVPYGTAYTGKYAPEKLSSTVRSGLESHADSTPRHSQEDAQLALARDAHRRAAVEGENGQVNSSQSPVPGNYNELDEDGAALLVMNLARYPEQQASVVMHEILYGGNRRKVIDAAGEYAHVAAQSRIAALLSSQRPGDMTQPGPPVANPGDPGIDAGKAATNVDFERRAAVTLGAQQIKDALGGKAGGVAGIDPPEPQFGGDGTPADEAAHDQTDQRLAERERLLDERQAQLDEMEERLRIQLEHPAGAATVTAGTVDANVNASASIPGDRRSEPDGGEAYGFDGKKGPNSKGYFTNDDLDKYAEQHDVEGVREAGNRQEKLDALKAAGHDKPETPKD